MSSLDYQGETFRQGVEHLKLLGRHADLVMRSYYGESIDLLEQDKAIVRLLDARVFSHVDEQGGPKLGEPARQLIAQLIADERRRKVNPEIGDFLEDIRHRTNQINQAQQQGNHAHADYLFGLLAQDVDDLNSRIIGGLESLWNRLNSDFAFVGSLPEKMVENEKAGQEVERWLEGLKMIDFAELIGLCGSNPRLRSLLVRATAWCAACWSICSVIPTSSRATMPSVPMSPCCLIRRSHCRRQPACHWTGCRMLMCCVSWWQRCRRLHSNVLCSQPPPV